MYRIWNISLMLYMDTLAVSNGRINCIFNRIDMGWHVVCHFHFSPERIL